MAKTTKKQSNKKSTAAKDGWHTSAIELPAELNAEFADAKKYYGYGSSKLIASIGIGFVASLPEETRRSLMDTLRNRLLDGHETITPREIGDMVAEALKSQGEGARQGIADPAVAPAPSAIPSVSQEDLDAREAILAKAISAISSSDDSGVVREPQRHRTRRGAQIKGGGSPP